MIAMKENWNSADCCKFFCFFVSIFSKKKNSNADPNASAAHPQQRTAGPHPNAGAADAAAREQSHVGRIVGRPPAERRLHSAAGKLIFLSSAMYDI